MNHKTQMSSKAFLISTLILGIFNFQVFISPAQATSRPKQSAATLCDEPTIVDENIDGKPYCVSRIIVKASPEQVWQVLTDYHHATKVFPLLKKCEVTQDHGSTKIVKHEIGPSGIPDTYEYLLEVHEVAPKVMEWHRISGDFKEVDGFWKLQPVNYGNYTEVTYASHVNGGFFLPQMLIRRQSRIDMPATIACLKKHTESATQIASRRQDPSTVTR